jgi:cell division FtsZ-interacting protein ZapD
MPIDKEKLEQTHKDITEFRKRWLAWTEYDPIERYATALQTALEVIEAYEKQEETIKMLRLLNDHSQCIEEGRIRMARIKELEQQSEKYREAIKNAINTMNNVKDMDTLYDHVICDLDKALKDK